jgi:hypothetical protein
MSAEGVIHALGLPLDARVDQRVPKKLLIENGAATSADKRQINDGIEELLWIAALKPTNIGVPEFRDANREYVEIAVLSLSLRPTGKLSRLIELIHRSIPYPLLLISEERDSVTISLAHKRFSQGEAGRVVLDGDVLVAEVFGPGRQSATDAAVAAFLAAVVVARQPSRNLFAMFQGWIDCLSALDAARFTGSFALRDSEEGLASRRSALEEHSRLQREITKLRVQAEKETQLNRLVELNLELKRLEAQLVETTGKM